MKTTGAGSLGHFEARMPTRNARAVTTALVTLNKRDQRNRCHVDNDVSSSHGPFQVRGLKKPLRGTGRTSTELAILACAIFSNIA